MAITDQPPAWPGFAALGVAGILVHVVAGISTTPPAAVFAIEVLRSGSLPRLPSTLDIESPADFGGRSRNPIEPYHQGDVSA
ncbi:MAG: hypothetical protein EOP94_02685 [Zymomonas sp.]|nr:MAG: hypothetical protein EOP94_02685 [Zymomonas sp.]